MGAPPRTVKRDCTHPRARHKHGTRLAYLQDGCGCFPCRAANSRIKAALIAGEDGPSEGSAPLVGAVRRLRALHRIGHSWASIADELGLTRQAVSQVANEKRIGDTIYAHTFEAISGLYDRLWNVHPQGTAALRARRNAERRGWHSPMAWDDDTIDDPDATPPDFKPPISREARTETARQERLTNALLFDDIAVERIIDARHPLPSYSWHPDRLEAVARMTGRGFTVSALARIFATSNSAIRNAISNQQAAVYATYADNIVNEIEDAA